MNIKKCLLIMSILGIVGFVLHMLQVYYYISPLLAQLPHSMIATIYLIISLVSMVIVGIIHLFDRKAYREDRARELFKLLRNAARKDGWVNNRGIFVEFRLKIEECQTSKPWQQPLACMEISYIVPTDGTFPHAVYVDYGEGRSCYSNILSTVFQAQSLFANPKSFNCSIYKPGKWEKLV